MVERREAMKYIGIGTALTLAGCTGGGKSDSGPTSIIYSSHESGSVAYSASQGLITVVNENTDKINFESRPSAGPSENIGRLEKKESDVGLVDLWTLDLVNNRKGDYKSLDLEPLQVMNLYTLPWMLCSSDKEITSYSDIKKDHNVFHGVAGTGSRAMWEQAMSHYVDEYQIREIGFTEQAGAFSEGALDVGMFAIPNHAVEPGWAQEMKATADLGMLSWPDNAEKIRNDDSVVVSEVDMTRFDGYDLFPHPNPEAIPAVTMSYNICAHQEYGYDPIYELLETTYEHRKELGEYHGLLTFFEDIEFWVSNVDPDVPFHPAAADFYQEHGVWKDDWERGEINE